MGDFSSRDGCNEALGERRNPIESEDEICERRSKSGGPWLTETKRLRTQAKQEGML